MSASPWGPDDEIGRLNWMTSASRADALARADASRPFDLAVDYFMGMPSWTRLGDPKYDIWLTPTLARKWKAPAWISSTVGQVTFGSVV